MIMAVNNPHSMVYVSRGHRKRRYPRRVGAEVTAKDLLLIRPYVIFDFWICGADLGFYNAEASAGRLRSWLRRLRSVEAERDGLAEKLEDAALFGGRR